MKGTGIDDLTAIRSTFIFTPSTKKNPNKKGRKNK